MILLDENIPESQRQLLRSWRIRAAQIGHEVGRSGMKDDEIIPLLHRTGPVIFFTRDLGFFRRELCHQRYSIVCLAVERAESASFVRKFLRNPATATWARRRGKVFQIDHLKIRAFFKKTRTEDTWV